MAATRYYSAKSLNPSGFTGTWAYGNGSNLTSFDHTNGADTSIVVIPVPKLPRTTGQDDPAISVIEVCYTVTTADLAAAPTAVLNKVTANTTTKVVTRAAVTQTLTFAGADAIGLAAGAGAAGTHSAVVTITTPARLADNEHLELELTMQAAATSVLKIQGAFITHTGA